MRRARCCARCRKSYARTLARLDGPGDANLRRNALFRSVYGRDPVTPNDTLMAQALDMQGDDSGNTDPNSRVVLRQNASHTDSGVAAVGDPSVGVEQDPSGRVRLRMEATNPLAPQIAKDFHMSMRGDLVIDPHGGSGQADINGEVTRFLSWEVYQRHDNAVGLPQPEDDAVAPDRADMGACCRSRRRSRGNIGGGSVPLTILFVFAFLALASVH